VKFQANNTTIGAEAIALTTSGGDLATQLVANLIGADVNGDLTPSVVGGNVQIDAADADNGGFTTVASAEPAVTGVGASSFGGTVLADADIITDFMSGEDMVDLNAVAGDGSATNYVEAAEVATFGDAVTAAAAAIDDTVSYFLTSSAAAGEEGLLFFDADGNGSVDGVVHLVGIDEDNFAFGDIIA
jgi:hypothetical protein